MADKEDPQATTAQGANGPPAPQNPPPPQNPEIPLVPNAPQVLQAPQALQQPTPHVPLLNWSHLKPKFSRKPDKEAEVHLLRTNDWMDMHGFQDNVKVQRFCLTLTEESRLWYRSLRLINVDWLGLQNILRQQYSKIGNTREQIFHAWRSFYFGKNAQTIDTLYTLHKTGHHTFRLSRTTNVRSL